MLSVKRASDRATRSWIGEARKRVKEAPKGERPSEFALNRDISIRVRMNLADRLKAHGTNESRTGAISVTQARCDACVCAYAYSVRAQYSRPGRVCTG